MKNLKPKRVISSRDYPEYGNNCPDSDWQAARLFNEHPEFDIKSKPYKFKGLVKTNTRSHGWHVEFNGEYFIVLQHRMYGASEYVSVFYTNSKQDFDGSCRPIKRFATMIDIETVADDFFANYEQYAKEFRDELDKEKEQKELEKQKKYEEYLKTKKHENHAKLLQN